MTENYEKYEGKEVIVYNNKKLISAGIVNGCNYDIGITIVSKDDPNNNIICLNGPSSPNFPEHGIDKNQYKQWFKLHIAMIKDRKFDAKRTGKMFNHFHGYGEFALYGMAECAYSQ